MKAKKNTDNKKLDPSADSLAAIQSAINFLEAEAYRNNFSYVVLGLRFAQLMILHQNSASGVITADDLLQKLDEVYKDMKHLLILELALTDGADFFQTHH